MSDAISLDVYEVMKYLPHRYPFMLVDRVLECVPGTSIRALKNVTFNEPFFPGHFPGRPVMPGVMIIEALAQVAGIFAFCTAGKVPDENTRFYFAGIDKARFRRIVIPGDQLILSAKLDRNFKGIWLLSTQAMVGEEEAASAQIMLAPDISGTAAGKKS